MKIRSEALLVAPRAMCGNARTKASQNAAASCSCTSFFNIIFATHHFPSFFWKLAQNWHDATGHHLRGVTLDANLVVTRSHRVIPVIQSETRIQTATKWLPAFGFQGKAHSDRSNVVCTRYFLQSFSACRHLHIMHIVYSFKNLRL